MKKILVILMLCLLTLTVGCTSENDKKIKVILEKYKPVSSIENIEKQVKDLNTLKDEIDYGPTPDSKKILAKRDQVVNDIKRDVTMLQHLGDISELKAYPLTAAGALQAVAYIDRSKRIEVAKEFVDIAQFENPANVEKMLNDITTVYAREYETREKFEKDVKDNLLPLFEDIENKSEASKVIEKVIRAKYALAYNSVEEGYAKLTQVGTTAVNQLAASDGDSPKISKYTSGESLYTTVGDLEDISYYISVLKTPQKEFFNQLNENNTSPSITYHVSFDFSDPQLSERINNDYRSSLNTHLLNVKFNYDGKTYELTGKEQLDKFFSYHSNRIEFIVNEHSSQYCDEVKLTGFLNSNDQSKTVVFEFEDGAKGRIPAKGFLSPNGKVASDYAVKILEYMK